MKTIKIEQNGVETKPKKILSEIEVIRTENNVSKHSIKKNTKLSKQTIYGIADGTRNVTINNLCEYCDQIGANIKIEKL